MSIQNTKLGMGRGDTRIRMIWDLITIGGGAAGFFAAITHAEHGGGPSLILEKTPQLLAKVRISGGGRCNVTHQPMEPKAFSKHYPRGEKALIGPLHRWGAEETIHWFRSKGVELKTEEDNRLFPVSDNSQCIVDCLTKAAASAKVMVRTKAGVLRIAVTECAGERRFTVETEHGEMLEARHVLLATGGTRQGASAKLAEQLGHVLAPAVPSLFTFKIKDERIRDLQGISVENVSCAVAGSRLSASGPLLITHWGVSGPGILRLSAWGARKLAEVNYRFSLRINWLPGVDAEAALARGRQDWGKRQMHSRSLFDEIPKRLWTSLLDRSVITAGQTWSQLTKAQSKELVSQLTSAVFEVAGKSLNKDEFVTCGGVPLKEINLKTMESKRCPGLYLAGEVMDVDGITGGFNFQNAWTSGYHAGKAIATTNFQISE